MAQSKELNIMCVCGFGLGTSLILKMTLDEIFKRNGIAAYVEPKDCTSAVGMNCDIIFSSESFKEQLEQGNPGIPVYVITDFVNKDEAEKIALPAVKKVLGIEE